jgi:3-methyladenine DNA glycosylase AlkD
MISTWYFTQHGAYTLTLKIAKLLVKDPHPLTQKAVGWMLKEVGKKDSGLLLGFLDQHALYIPRPLLRCAVEKLSPEQKKCYLSA